MQIRRVDLSRFRGIREMSWCPAPGINLVLGPGDAGKTSILDGIALALTPQPSQAAAEADYWNLDTAEPFAVTLTIGALSEEFSALSFPAPLWGWDPTTEELHPAPDDEKGWEPVIRVQVTGTPELELQHRMLQPAADDRPFPVAHRHAAGLWNVTTTRIASTQLRVSSGSLLERAVGRGTLRAPAAQMIQGAQELLQLPAGLAETVQRLEEQLLGAGIDVQGLRLGLVPSPGQSPVQLISLVVPRGEGQVPLASFGRGSQQMAMLALAAAEVAGQPIAVVDEIETGLEPYRQRALFERLRSMLASGGQAFITTHSPTVVCLTKEGEAWRIVGSGDNIQLVRVAGVLHRAMIRDPEALLCRLPLVCEGATEIGVLTTLFRSAGHDIDVLGIRLVDGGGHTDALALIESLSHLGVEVLGLVDNEIFGSGKRAEVAALPGVRLTQPEGGRCIEEAIVNAIPPEALEALVARPGDDGPYLQVNDRLQTITGDLGAQSRKPVAELIAEHGEAKLRETIGRIAARKGWFKSVQGGEDLGAFLLDHLPAGSPMRDGLMALCLTAVRQVTHSHAAQ
ncbi:MAG: ATP-dependent nuclease [Candidatus Dormibacteria bacterium]